MPTWSCTLHHGISNGMSIKRSQLRANVNDVRPPLIHNYTCSYISCQLTHLLHISFSAMQVTSLVEPRTVTTICYLIVKSVNSPTLKDLLMYLPIHLKVSDKVIVYIEKFKLYSQHRLNRLHWIPGYTMGRPEYIVPQVLI